MNKKKTYCPAVVLTILLGAFIGPQGGLAAVDTATLDIESPAFTSPAQAQQAARLAQQAALSDDSLQRAIQDIEDAKNDLDRAVRSHNPAAVETARDRLADVESTYVDRLAEITGVIDDDINVMRDSGMGWREIAHELGVHSDLPGMGHAAGNMDMESFRGDRAATPSLHGIDAQELVEATARNMESGWSRGHGTGIRAGVQDAGFGLSVDRRGDPESDGEHDGGGLSGAGGLGGGSGGAGAGDHGGTDAGDAHGGVAGSGGGPGGHSGGGSSAESGHGTAGADGSPGAGSGSDHGGDSGMSGGADSGGHGGDSGGHGGDSDGEAH